jgi:hypothetical protein
VRRASNACADEIFGGGCATRAVASPPLLPPPTLIGLDDFVPSDAASKVLFGVSSAGTGVEEALQC